MGYRSDVAYTIRFKDVGAMTVFIAEAQGNGLQPALDECTVNHRKLQINFFAESVKWYDSFPEVQAFDSFWDKFCDLANGEHDKEGDDPVFWACELIRIGENDDDVDDAEERGSDEPEQAVVDHDRLGEDQQVVDELGGNPDHRVDSGDDDNRQHP